MKTTRTKAEGGAPRAELDGEEASGVSVSIRWRHGGWALAVVIAALVLARLFGLF